MLYAQLWQSVEFDTNTPQNSLPTKQNDPCAQSASDYMQCWEVQSPCFLIKSSLRIPIVLKICREDHTLNDVMSRDPQPHFSLLARIPAVRCADWLKLEINFISIHITKR